MFSTLRNRFGIPGVISVIALVFAMVGGAFAANNLGDSGNGATVSAKKKKAAKGPRGPRGPKGATGAAGPAGPAGPAGAPGAKGDAGANGSNGAAGDKGATGANGQGVTTSVEPPFGECGEQEGVELTSASGTNYVCNGLPGQDGLTGFTETLPAGKTETGTWSFSATETSALFGRIYTTLSYNIPLANPLPGSNVHYNIGTPVPAECDDGVAPPPSVSHPEADAGHLCVFPSANVFGVEPGVSIETLDGNETAGSSTVGAALLFQFEFEPALGYGSFAVTG